MDVPSREDLIGLCERGVVPQDRWSDRDSSKSQRQLGECLALLRAGCAFQVITAGTLRSTDTTWWLCIEFRGFQSFEYGLDEVGYEDETFYVPTAERLERAAGGDWY